MMRTRFFSPHVLLAVVLSGALVIPAHAADYVHVEGFGERGLELNLPRLKSRDSCFIDRCHCWSYTVSTGVTSGSSCRTD